MAELRAVVQETMDSPKEIVLWNYYDHEHVVGTHYRHYQSIRIYSEDSNFCFSDKKVRFIGLGLRLRSYNFSHILSPTHFVSYQIMKFGMMKQDFKLEDTGPQSCKVTLENRLEIPFFLAPILPVLQPLFQWLSTKWFYATWDEDAPMRRRRWKVWQLGFRNFSGIDYINNKTEKPADLGKTVRPYPVELPVPKSTSILKEGYERPFSRSTEVGYGSMPEV